MRFRRWVPQATADEAAELGGMSRLRAWEAGLTADAGCWTQPVRRTIRDPRLDPASPQYDEEYKNELDQEIARESPDREAGE